jgi:hypothetical protein
MNEKAEAWRISLKTKKSLRKKLRDADHPFLITD